MQCFLRSWFVALSFVLISATSFAQRDVLIDHDGGIDDFLAMTVLLCDPHSSVSAITLAPADSYRASASRVMKLMVDHLGVNNLTLAASDLEGTHPFPHPWRMDSSRVEKLLKAQASNPSNRFVQKESPEHLVELLSEGKRYTILETGPFSNIAEALRLKPSIKNNIERIYAMGGAVRVPGNVEADEYALGHDGSAEWNIYNNAVAAKQVLESGIPVTLIPLDATNSVPLDYVFLERLKKTKTHASQLAWNIYNALDVKIQSNYFFWDTLTAAVMVDPGLVRTESLRIKVHTQGASEGRTEELPLDSSDGSRVDVAVSANKKQVHEAVLKLFRECRWKGQPR